MPKKQASTKFANALLFSLALHVAVWIAVLFIATPALEKLPPKTQVTFVQLAPRLGTAQGTLTGGTQGSGGEKSDPLESVVTEVRELPMPKENPVKDAKPSKPKAKTPPKAPQSKTEKAPAKKTAAKPQKPVAAKPANSPKTTAKKTNKTSVSTKPNVKNLPVKSAKKEVASSKNLNSSKNTSSSKNTASAKPGPKNTTTTEKSNGANSTAQAAKPSGPSESDQKMASALASLQKDLDGREGGDGGGSGDKGPSGSGVGAGSGEKIGGGNSSGTGAAAGSPNGDVNSAAYRGYQSSVKSKVQSKWFRPNNPDGVKKRAVIKVRIDASGNVIAKSIRKSSGDASFDSSVLRAVEQASPFPLPPSALRDEAVRDGFAIEMVGR